MATSKNKPAARGLSLAAPVHLEPQSFNADIAPLLPKVDLIIGGKKRRLAFDLFAIVTVEKLTGLNLLSAATFDASATTIQALLYAALLPGEPKLKLAAVGEWINTSNVSVIHQAVLQAWFESVRPADPDGAKGEDEAQPAS